MEPAKKGYILESKQSRKKEDVNQSYSHSGNSSNLGNIRSADFQKTVSMVALLAATEFANGVDERQMFTFEMLFQLARRLQGVAGARERGVKEMAGAFQLFCTTIHDSMSGVENFLDFSDEGIEDRWIEFVDMWHIVKFPEGQGVLDMAFKSAKEAPIKLAIEDDLGRDFTTVASVAYYLQREFRGDEPIILPVKRIGELLGKTAMHGTRLVRLLGHYGLIEEVDSSFSYASHKARTYKFLIDSGKYEPPRRLRVVK